MNRSVSNEPEDMGVGVINSLPVSKIQVLAEENLRRVDPKFIPKLAKNIKKNGLLQSVVVRPLVEPVNGFTHQLDAGYQRMAAIVSLGWDEVPVKIVDAETTAMSVNMSENGVRKDVNYVETAQGVKRRMDAGDKVADIADDLGKSVPYIHQILPMLGLRKTIQTAIAENKFTFRVARALPGMTEEEQDQLLADVEAAGKGNSTDVVESAVRRKKKKTGQGRKGRGGKAAKEDVVSGAATISTKKALILIDEAAGTLKEAAKAEGVTMEDSTAAKEAMGILSVFKKFLTGGIGVQALGKQLTKRMAEE